MNIYSVVLELAKQELIQKPYIMVCSWSKVMHKLRSFPEFCCFDAVHQYYSSANPTNKAAISLFDVEPKSDAERECLRFLQRYIRGLDKSQLIKFLRFTTGPDIAVDKITIDFIKSDGMQRKPIAQTCRPVLELSYTYQNFCELRDDPLTLLD